MSECPERDSRFQGIYVLQNAKEQLLRAIFIPNRAFQCILLPNIQLQTGVKMHFAQPFKDLKCILQAHITAYGELNSGQ